MSSAARGTIHDPNEARPHLRARSSSCIARPPCCHRISRARDRDGAAIEMAPPETDVQQPAPAAVGEAARTRRAQRACEEQELRCGRRSWRVVRVAFFLLPVPASLSSQAPAGACARESAASFARAPRLLQSRPRGPQSPLARIQSSRVASTVASPSAARTRDRSRACCLPSCALPLLRAPQCPPFASLPSSWNAASLREAATGTRTGRQGGAAAVVARSED